MAKRRFKCPKCERRFSMAAHLARHINAIHRRKKTEKAAEKKRSKRTARTRVARKRALSTRRVVLTTGYEIELADEGGLEHLFNAIAGESIVRMRGTADFARRGLESVFDRCLLELHYVAGQLRQAGSGMALGFLLGEFGVQWERITGGNDEDNDDKE